MNGQSGGAARLEHGDQVQRVRKHEEGMPKRRDALLILEKVLYQRHASETAEW